jgi:hypothetical protein
MSIQLSAGFFQKIVASIHTSPNTFLFENNALDLILRSKWYIDSITSFAESYEKFSQFYAKNGY